MKILSYNILYVGGKRASEILEAITSYPFKSLSARAPPVKWDTIALNSDAVTEYADQPVSQDRIAFFQLLATWVLFWKTRYGSSGVVGSFAQINGIFPLPFSCYHPNIYPRALHSLKHFAGSLPRDVLLQSRFIFDGFQRLLPL